ncbi:MAG: fibronectin type III domain-containing protein, partial [Actinomycetota bacterium]|nr:fibronectin type III domain-containing protein [Actinomycetota bacterium]
LGETGGTTAADAMAVNPGTYGSGPTLGANSLISADTANKAVQFDGATQYVRVPNSGTLGLTANVSLEAWIKPDALPAAGSFASVASKPEAYALQFNGPRLEFTIMQSGTRRRLQAPAGAVVAGQTYHVVGTYDGTTSRLYLNGAQVASMPLSGPITNSGSSLNLGSWNTTDEYLKGTIDDVAVFGTPLSAARVKAHYDAGTGGAPPSAPAPSPPSGLTATTANSGRVDLTWTDNSNNETNFVVERDTSSSFASPTVATVGADVSSYADTGLSPSTTYYYRVKAKNATGPSAYSNVASATTSPPPPPAAPSLLNATAVSSSRIDLQWTDNSGVEANMVVERDTSSSFASPTVTTLPADTTTYSDTGLSPSTTYYYRVKAKNATGSSGYSNTSSATTKPPPPSTTYAQEVIADAPVSYWRLGETSGTAAADARNANPGTFLNGTTLGASSLLGSDTANKAASFDGVDDQVRVTSSTSLRLGSPLSLEAWLKPSTIPASGSFASVLTKADSYSLQFNGPRLEFTVMQAGARKRLQAAAGAVVAGSTYHVVGTYDGTTQRLYINGAQVASAALTGSATANGNSLYIASWNGSSEFAKGTIDEVAVYPTALSATRVSAHYNAGK